MVLFLLPRILEKDDNNIDACQVLTLHTLAREGDITVVSSWYPPEVK